MKTQILRSDDRGHTQAGWLDSRHSFSFGEYYDPSRMGFGPLRVINEDVVAPSQGFPTHPHRDMEILTYIVSGAVAHRDTLGTESVLRAGELQRMTAGSGIRHSEYNPSDSEPLHLLQIWIEPDRDGLPPSYEQKAIDVAEGNLAVVASANADEGGLFLHQDARVLRGHLAGTSQATYTLKEGRLGWVQVVSGTLRLLGDGNADSGADTTLVAGDAAALRAQAGSAADGPLRFATNDEVDFLFFDLPA